MHKKLPLLVVLILLVSMLLVACGDSTATTGSAATTAAATSAAAATTVASAATTAAAMTSAAATTTAATSAAATSAAATTVAATTSAATTAAATTAAAGGSSQVVQYDAGGIKLLDPRPTYTKLAPAGKKGGNVNLATVSDGKSLHPYLTSDTVSTAYQQFLWAAALAQTDPVTGLGAPNFRVVTGVKVSDDKLTYTFTLKDGLKWSDGQAITADDYVWTYKQALDPANKWPYVEDYADLIESVTSTDPKTVVFKMKQAEIYALDKAGAEPLPKHIWEGKDWSDPTKNSEIDAPTVVSGPWKLKEWKREQFITFARNDASTIFPAPLLDSITYQVVKQSTVQVQKLKAGELDVVGISPTDYDDAKKATNATFLEYYRPSYNFDYIGFNFRKTYLQDIAIRKAIALATPQKDLIEKLQFGLAQPISSAVPQSHPFYNPATPKYDYNIDAAKKVLTDAGYKIDNGKLKDKTGKELPKMKFLFNTGNRVREGIATVGQQTYKELGIDLELVPLEFQAYLSALKKEPFDYDLFVLGWQSGADIETFDQVWSAIPSLNSGGWDTDAKKQVVELHKKAKLEFDLSKRKELMGQIQVLEGQDLPYVFLYQGKAVVAVSNKVNVSPLLADGIIYNLRTDWSLK